MELEKLRQLRPLTVSHCQTVEDINRKLSLNKNLLRQDFKFWMYLAAHLGGIYDRKQAKFLSYFEYDPMEKTLSPARIRISDYINEKSVIKRKGMIYLSGLWKTSVESQVKEIQSKTV